MDPNSEVNRFILPIHHPPHVGTTTYDAKDPDTSFPPIIDVRPPTGAPNVLIVLLDDIGFGASSAFGGAVNTPTADRLAAGGIKLSRFHTTALCAPSRAALLTGRNHHTVGMGAIPEVATSAPGYSSIRPKRQRRWRRSSSSTATRRPSSASAMRSRYGRPARWDRSTTGPPEAALTTSTASSAARPTSTIRRSTREPRRSSLRRPPRRATTSPRTSPIRPSVGPPAEGAAARQAVLRLLRPRCHPRPAPCRPRSGRTNTEAASTHGWDALRDEDLRPAEGTGGHPRRRRTHARPDEIQAWDDVPDVLKPVLARQMEVYAGFLEHTDHHVGRVIDPLEELDVLDDTLVFYIIGDNGASAEGTPNGTSTRLFSLNGAAAFETPSSWRPTSTSSARPEAYNHYAVGWAHAMCTPYQWTKQVASHFGGTRNGTIVHWPNGFAARGEVRHQFHHVIDVAPTMLDVGRASRSRRWSTAFSSSPSQGVSMAYLLRRRRGARPAGDPVLRDGLQPRDLPQGLDGGDPAQHPVALRSRRSPALDDDVWELYDTVDGLDPGPRPGGRATRASWPSSNGSS